MSKLLEFTGTPSILEWNLLKVDVFCDFLVFVHVDIYVHVKSLNFVIELLFVYLVKLAGVINLLSFTYLRV